MANWKKKVKSSNASQGGGPYVGPGKHLLRLDLIKEIDSQNNEDLVVAEFVVEETDSEEPDHKVGTRVSRLWNMTQHKSAPSNYKAFLLAAFGTVDDGEFEALDEDDLTDDMINAASSADNPLNGALFFCAAHTIITKTNKKEFTKCRWELREYPLSDEDDE